MYVSVSDQAITLEDPDDVRSFKLVVSGSVELDRALRDGRWGRLEGPEALISVDAVERAASGRVGADWADRFQGMVTYARDKGWLSRDGTEIRAHVERGV